jgi:hypothetical protein
LPAWVSNWSTVDKTLMNIADINKDGIVQLAEIVIGGDLIVLATPEIAGLPYVISGLVAAGGLAAALSTADGLLLTIANALSHDLYYKMIDPNASTVRRLAVSKGLLLVVALLAAYVTSLKPGDILFLVGAAFSLAASGFFPALVCGVFWKRANYLGAVLGMSSLGLGICAYYMYLTYPFFGVNAPKWWDINPISAGTFGIPAGFLGIIIGSLISPAPSKEVRNWSTMSAIRTWKATSTPRASDKVLWRRRRDKGAYPPSLHRPQGNLRAGFFMSAAEGGTVSPCTMRPAPEVSKVPGTQSGLPPVSDTPGIPLRGGRGESPEIFRRTHQRRLMSSRWKHGRYPLAGHVWNAVVCRGT